MEGVEGVSRTRPEQRAVLEGAKLSRCPKLENVDSIEELKVPFSLQEKGGEGGKG